MNCFVSGIYGAMAVAGSFICSITGIDSLGGFHLSLDAIVQGLGYAVPPIMALLFILDVSSSVYTKVYDDKVVFLFVCLHVLISFNPIFWFKWRCI